MSGLALIARHKPTISTRESLSFVPTTNVQRRGCLFSQFCEFKAQSYYRKEAVCQ